MWITPKLDWLPTDFYNFEDLNRVENNTSVVAEYLQRFVDLPQLIVITNRDMQHIEFADSLNRIEHNQDVLRQRYTPTEWIENKLDWAYGASFSHEDAQRLEHNLNLLYRHYKGNEELIPHCGVFTCGEALV